MRITANRFFMGYTPTPRIYHPRAHVSLFYYLFISFNSNVENSNIYLNHIDWNNRLCRNRG